MANEDKKGPGGQEEGYYKRKAMASKQREIEEFPDLGGNILRDYPLEEEFTSILPKWYTVPEGYSVVNYRAGGSKNIPPYLKFLLPKPVDKEPGIRFIFGFGGLVKSSYVVNRQVQTEDLEALSVLTVDGAPIVEIDSTLNYQVKDPHLAMTAVRDYRQTTFERANAIVTETASNKTLKELLELKEDGENLLSGAATPILDNIGVEGLSLRIEQIVLPQELQAALAQEAIRAAEAAGIEKLADAEVYKAEKLNEAADHIKDNPTAIYLELLDALRKSAEKGSTFYQAPSFAPDWFKEIFREAGISGN